MTTLSEHRRSDPASIALAQGVRVSRIAAPALGALGLAAQESGLGLGAVLAIAGLGLLIGLPHGSVDHLLAARLTGRPVPLAAAAYGAVALLGWALLLAPGPVGVLALLLVLGLSLVHFALGELEVWRALSGWTPPTPVAVCLGLAGTGALLLPLARAGGDLVGVARAVAPWLGDLLASPGVRLALGLAWALAAAVAVLAAWRADHRGIALDVVVIAALGALAPPLVAFGAWFGAWHGLRHLARLLAEEPGSARLLQAGHERAAIAHLVRQARWPSVAALATVVVLLVVTTRAADPTTALAASLVALLALTVPHMAVVARLDLRHHRARRAASGVRPR